ncbi:hypothetical protein [Paraburkholderia dipogonis]|uniref:hypothetical protein n=1 Tax=Paraburkholderia dipogonis TaxID=1211383 RepID=UPI0038BCF856
MRTQLNLIVLAILGDNAGPGEPSETYPGMMWGDTTAMRLRRRNNVNDAWIDIGPLDDFLGDVKKLVSDTAAGKVSKVGDTMTGSLTMKAANISYQYASGANAGYIGTYGTGGAGSGIGIVNSAWNAWNFQVDDSGGAIFRSTVTIANNGGLYSGGRITIRNSAELALQGPYVFYIRPRGNSGLEYVNNAYNNVVGSIDDAGNMACNGEMRTGGALVAGTTMYTGNGQAFVSGDGNVYGAVWGGYLSNWMGNKANVNARVQWDSGVAEWGPINGPTTLDIPAPWVMCGWRTNSNGNWVSGAQWLRGVCLRNQ